MYVHLFQAGENISTIYATLLDWVLFGFRLGLKQSFSKVWHRVNNTKIVASAYCRL